MYLTECICHDIIIAEDTETCRNLETANSSHRSSGTGVMEIKMKTAIIYRANETIDANLLGLKDKVDFFFRFEPQELPRGTMYLQARITDLMKEVITTEAMGAETELRLFSDITCAPGIIAFKSWSPLSGCGVKMNLSLISQETGPLQEYVSSIAEEGKLVIVVRENLADHVILDGIDPYSLPKQDRDLGGWYHAKVLSIWEEVLSRKGAECRIVLASDEIFDTSLEDCVVICDHHCCNNNLKIYQNVQGDEDVWRNAYRASTSSIVKIEDIPIL